MTTKRQPTAAAREAQGDPADTPRLPRGYGSMRDVPLNIDPRIDLTQPIYEQVLALQKLDREADERAASKLDRAS